MIGCMIEAGQRGRLKRLCYDADPKRDITGSFSTTTLSSLRMRRELYVRSQTVMRGIYHLSDLC